VATHPQAEKRNRQRIVRQSHHRHFRSTMRTYIKRTQVALQKGEKDVAEKALKIAIPLIDRCAQKNVIPKKRASRMVARLTRAVQSIGA